MWPDLNLSLVLFKVRCPLGIIFDRGLKPKLSCSKHGSGEVNICLALFAFAVHDGSIVKDGTRAGSSQSLPQGGAGT